MAVGRGMAAALIDAGARVTAVERDRRCLPALAELSEAHPGQLRVIDADAIWGKLHFLSVV